MTRLIAVAALCVGSIAALAAGPKASYTTTNAGVDGPGHCYNGGTAGDPVNCNIYGGKKFVWLNGGPVGAALGEGTYFFAVFQPSAQSNPNDGSPDLLSYDVAGDPYTNRMFKVEKVGDDFVVTYLGAAGAHSVSGNSIRLGLNPDFAGPPGNDWYETTQNGGGVYVIGICSLKDGYPVSPSACKYDAFKIVDIPQVCACGTEQDGSCTPCDCPCGVNDPVTGACSKDCVPNPVVNISKDAVGSYAQKWTWSIDKVVDGPVVRYLTSGSTVVKYIVAATPLEVVTDVKVTGTISVENAGDDGVSDGVVTDSLISPAGGCTVDDPDAFTFIAISSSASSTYKCLLPDGKPSVDIGLNTAKIDYTIATGNGDERVPMSPAPSTVASFTWDVTVDEASKCATVVDVNWLGSTTLDTQLCVGEDGTYTYTRTIPAPSGCADYNNTATVTPGSGAADSDGATVKVCGSVRGGALTIGYWSNKNGQSQISQGAVEADGTTCKAYTYLSTLAPFYDIANYKTCAKVATYVGNVIKLANASGASMQAMLKAQMLATALNVFFSTTTPKLGLLDVDLTKVCKLIATCVDPLAPAPNGFEVTSPAFDGRTHWTINELLAWAASKFVEQPTTPKTYKWYDEVKSVQELAKDTFDAINNSKIFAWSAP